MAIADVLKFIDDFRNNNELRNALNSIMTAGELSRYLQWNGYNFSSAEFEDGLRALLLKCRDEDAAAEIREIGLWYKYQGGAQ
jgi:hypothetical protein